MIIAINAERAFYKIKHLFMIKYVSKLKIKEKIVNVIKGLSMQNKTKYLQLTLYLTTND